MNAAARLPTFFSRLTKRWTGIPFSTGPRIASPSHAGGVPECREYGVTRSLVYRRGLSPRGAQSHLIVELEHRIEQLKRYDERIAEIATNEEYSVYVGAMSVLRGIRTLSAMTLLSELGDLRRFPTAPELMSAVGLIPGEFSTGDKTNRLSITKTGNAHVRHIVVEAAWHYRRGPRVGKGVRARRAKQPPEIVAIAEKCDHRLSKKFYRFTSRGKKSTVTAVAVARELVGFIWAIGQKVHP